MVGSYLLIGVAIIICFGIILLFKDRFYHWVGRQREDIHSQNSLLLRESLDKDRQIKKLNFRINELVDLNSRYLSFIFNAPAIMQGLNTSSNLREITSSIIEMAKNIALTEKVELFLFDAADNYLKKVTESGNSKEDQTTFAFGEDIIGVAAEKRFIIMRDHYTQQYNSRNKTSQFWIAVPIVCKEKLLGVLGIGDIEKPVGNESDLLKMIADIAGVALFNHVIISDAQQKANTDPLTTLNNRHYFYKMAQYYLEKSLKDGTEISIFLFDIDNFKHYNDTNGHSAGDKLLIELSRLLRSASRRNMTIVRYGGEEFIIMLPGISKEKALIYADRLRAKISEHTFHNREKQPLGFISISGGVASYPRDGDSIDSIIHHADKALYQAKSEGKNRVFPYQPQELQNTCLSAGA